MHASTYLLKRLDGVYHATLRFITNACSRTHHCLLCNYVGWSSLCQRRKSHMSLYIVKTLLGMLPNYITSLLCLCGKNYSTRSSNGIKLVVPRLYSKQGKSCFSYYAPWLWNELQSNTPLETIPPLNICKKNCSVKWMYHVAVLINLLIYDESFCFDCLEFIMCVIYLCELFVRPSWPELPGRRDLF